MSTSNKIIDRVIFCLTNNENYIDFWNYISKLYKVKFDVTPTLFFSGSNEEFLSLISSNKLSNKYGELINLQRVDGIDYNPSLDWSCTWGLFYGASLFPNDVCMLSGIDQIPLNFEFFKEIKKIDARKNYIVGFGNAYNSQIKNNYGNIVYPSSHHVGLGKFFKLIYNIKNNWGDELKQVFEHKNLCDNNNYWGLDELYSSYMIQKHINNKNDCNIIIFDDFFNKLINKRITRNEIKNITKNKLIENIKNENLYEYHSTRPFNTNIYMDDIFESINIFRNDIN